MPTTSNFGWTTPADTDLVKDGAAAIRTLGNGIDASFLDLKGGTTGQVLSKATNTDLDFTWTTVTADITEVNAGVGISGGGTSGAVTITNSMATAIDAKGDLVAGTGADTFSRLAVGADNTVLTADSTTATGLKWASPSSAANFTLLNAGGTALTGAQTVTVSGISGQNTLHIRIESASSASASSAIGLRINTDSGSNYLIYMLQSFPGSTYDAGALQAPAPSTVTVFPIGQMPANAAANVSGGILIQGANSSGIKVINGLGGANGGTNAIAWFGYGHYTGSSTVSSISLFSATGNFDNGTVFVYGSAS